MAEKISLTGVSETLLVPLFIRAQETQRPDAMLKDEYAVGIVKQLGLEASPIPLSGHDAVALIQRNRTFDRFARDFLTRHPNGVVVHLGCGLDTRFERVDNGQVEWFDLDLPAVIDLRRKLIREENPRHHLISDSAFSHAWLDTVEKFYPRPFLFISEAVLVYFETEQVKGLVVNLRQRFPGSELVCDANTPFLVWADNLQLAMGRLNARMRWGMNHPREMEGWAEGIHLMDEWYYFNDPEPRMAPYRWMGKISFLAKSTGIFHYRLGNLQ